MSNFSALIVYLSTSRMRDPCTVTTSPVAKRCRAATR
jgi:hypothetical protein